MGEVDANAAKLQVFVDAANSNSNRYKPYQQLISLYCYQVMCIHCFVLSMRSIGV